MSLKSSYDLSLPEQIKFSAQLLEQGNVIGLPTETVYGLAARIDRRDGIQRIFSTKKRPFFDPLIVHVSSIDQGRELLLSWSEVMQVLAQKFWPGPLTLVGTKKNHIDDLITSGLSTVGVRWPRNSVAQNLLEQVGVPLAAPSANLFGQLSPTTAQSVREVFQDQVFVLDGGDCDVGIESTIVHVDEQRISILRPGMITKIEIENCLQAAKIQFEWSVTEKKMAPGQMKHHYMPSVPLILYSNPDMTDLEIAHKVMSEISQLPDEIEHVRIQKPQKIEKIAYLSLSEDVVLAARQLYASLRQSALQKPDVICFQLQSFHQKPEWSAVMDRLLKAASLKI